MPATVLPRSSHKIEQLPYKSVQLNDLPSSAILIDALKPLENTLIQRGLAGEGGAPNHPLWFLAETERNVFLWRHGLSLADQGRFEFWVDVPGLIERRCRQVSSAIEEPGFGNPFIGEGERTSASMTAEVSYLQEMRSRLERIYLQAF
ncbi:MAG: hypothetical protein EBZ48_13445, partial [Proteobacteria bacterium]|nr:hypothetical protein [Pseudomonadota bacterium]